MKKVSAYSLPKNPTKMGAIRWKILGIGFLIAFMATWGITQYVASQFQYQAALGMPIMMIGSFRIYPPWRFIQWLGTWYFIGNSSIRHIFENALLLFAAGLVLSISSVIVFMYRYSRSFDSDNDNLHGSAHWASEKEVKNTGLVDNQKGVYR
jgi:type IV secretion system protein VirD4